MSVVTVIDSFTNIFSPVCFGAVKFVTVILLEQQALHSLGGVGVTQGMDRGRLVDLAALSSSVSTTSSWLGGVRPHLGLRGSYEFASYYVISHPILYLPRTEGAAESSTDDAFQLPLHQAAREY